MTLETDPTNRAPEAIAKKYYPRLVICEGPSDQAIISALLRVNAIQDIQVVHASGRDKFDRMLRAARVQTFKRLLIISDCDDKPPDSFRLVCDQIAKAAYDRPQKPREIIEPTATNPGVEVLMIPWDDEDGCIETVCIPPLRELYPAALACVDALCKCVNILGIWTKKQLAEMQVQCVLSCTQLPNPRVGLQIFAARTACPLNFKHDSFRRITEYLKEFSTRPV